MPLHPFQTDDVEKLRVAVHRYGSAVYVAATGSGKTIVAGEIARRTTKKGNRTLMLVHRRELVAQTVETLNEFCPGLEVGVEAPGWPSMPWAQLQVGMVQTLVQRPDHGIAPVLVIMDEAHHVRAATWSRVLGYWPRAKRLGLTGTPERLDGQGLGEHFAEMVLAPSIPELIAGRYLAPTKTLTLPAAFKDEDAPISEQMVASAADAYMRYARGKRTIFFGKHRDHSRRVCAALRERGVRAEHVDAEDPVGRRDRIMDGFKRGALDVVGNCRLIDEGYNAPACEVVMMGSPTNSVTQYLQWAGRQSRYVLGKTGLVLDLAGNVYEHGLPDEAREWSLEDGEIADKRDTPDRKPRACAACRAAFYGRRCPHCGYQEELAAVAEVNTELVDATDAAARARSRRRPKGRRHSRTEVNRLLREIHDQDLPPAEKREAAFGLAERLGYKRTWAARIIQLWGVA